MPPIKKGKGLKGKRCDSPSSTLSSVESQASPGSHSTQTSAQPTTSRCDMDTNEGIHALFTSLKGYLASGQFADLTIRVADEEFKVHKVIVCGQSEFFSRMFSSDWKENVNNEVKLGEVDPSAVEAMIHFMYGIDYDSSGSSRGRVSPLFFNAQIYALAEEYEVQKLKELAKEKFATSVRACWDMDDFPPVIVEVYNTTPSADRGLRDVIVNTCVEHIEPLLLKEAFLDVLESCNHFAADIARQLASKPSKPSKYRCSQCGYA
ncbi:hypothetical protein D8B26_002583 [Coccidioides posadasii str. Silveira]|uniref:uncharacterized protein n=1 Tax=Coccidioides posadasii (strain RMSCC 757 / Silveira) TaxID=443226 RepID=UPI001BEEFB4F|nr:hypothetical protein D8B26_002583 [Coccidioides posadasii str. Silveira]